MFQQQTSTSLLALLLAALSFVAAAQATTLPADRQSTSSSLNNEATLTRKSIVFDPSTPNVFYCPQKKPNGHEKMIVRARPLEKLCEWGGGGGGRAKSGGPRTEPSDCYDDLDETEYACEEKKRIQIRLDLGQFGTQASNRLADGSL